MNRQKAAPGPAGRAPSAVTARPFHDVKSQIQHYEHGLPSLCLDEAITGVPQRARSQWGAGGTTKKIRGASDRAA